MNRKLKDEDMDILFRGILKLQTVEDCYDFFEDLCTIAELRAMVQRFQVARMLDEGRIYSDIVQETGASTATISRVNKCLVYGSDGYRKMLDRLKEDETAEESHEVTRLCRNTMTASRMTWATRNGQTFSSACLSGKA